MRSTACYSSYYLCFIQVSFNTTPPKPLDAVGHYPASAGPATATGVRPLRHLSASDYTGVSTQPPPSRPTAPAYSAGPGPGPGQAVYPPGVVPRTRAGAGQPQPAGFPAGGVVDCHGNAPGTGMYPASSCHQQPSPLSAATFTGHQPAPHQYPVSTVDCCCCSCCYFRFLSVSPL